MLHVCSEVPSARLLGGNDGGRHGRREYKIDAQAAQCRKEGGSSKTAARTQGDDRGAGLMNSIRNKHNMESKDCDLQREVLSCPQSTKPA